MKYLVSVLVISPFFSLSYFCIVMFDYYKTVIMCSSWLNSLAARCRYCVRMLIVFCSYTVTNKWWWWYVRRESHNIVIYLLLFL